VVDLPIDSLVPYPRNARRGDLDLLVESLRTHGQYAPIIVQKSTRHVLRGNHLLAAAKRLGWTKVSVQLISVDDEQARRILLMDNRASDRATYDVDGLVDLLASLPTLAATGYGDDDLAQLLEQLQHNHAGSGDLVGELHQDGDDNDGDGDDDDDEDDRVAASRGVHVAVGDVVALGEHRSLCGDPRDLHAWERLLSGEKIQLLIVYAPEMFEAAETTDGLADSFAAADLSLSPGACVLLFRHHGARGLDELSALSSRWQYEQEIVRLHKPIKTTATFPVVHSSIALAQKVTTPPKSPANRTGTTSVWTTDTPAAVAVDALSDAGTAVAVAYPTDADALLACENGGRTAHLLQPNPHILTSIVATWEEAGGAPPRRR